MKHHTLDTREGKRRYRMVEQGAAGLGAALLILSLVACGGSERENSENQHGHRERNLPIATELPVSSNARLPQGDGKAHCPESTTLAYIGAVTGTKAQLGLAIYNGTRLAVDQHNAANPGCQVRLEKFDTEGDPTKAAGPVTEAANRQEILGVVGLPFSGESKAVGNIFHQTGLVQITPAATAPILSTRGWKTFFRGLVNDSLQGPAVIKLLKTTLGHNKVYLVHDENEYGEGLAEEIKKNLKKDELVGIEKITAELRDFSVIISKIQRSKVDAVFYAGYYSEAAPFDQQLVAKGWKGDFLAPDGTKDDQFIQQAGKASENAYFTCPCIPGELIAEFSTAYQKSFGKMPGTFSVEAYDAATILLAGLDAGKQSRSELLEWVKSYEGEGLSKRFGWNDQGELDSTKVYAYKVDQGKIVSLGAID